MNIMEEIPKDRPKTPPPISFSTSMKKNTINSDSLPSNYQPVSSSLGFFDWKMFFIFLLLIIVILTYFGINVLHIFGDAIETGVSNLSPSFKSFFGLVDDSTGSAINNAADIQVNSLGIDFVDKNERYIESVVGSSVVVLHIRAKK